MVTPFSRRVFPRCQYTERYAPSLLPRRPHAGLGTQKTRLVTHIIAFTQRHRLGGFSLLICG
nr:MAG TPA: hypothetical protein [Caudoviricetes sp.]